MVHTKSIAKKLIAAGMIMGTVALGAGCATHSNSSEHRTAGQTVDDATLVARVKAALAANPNTKAHQINVNAYEGEVTLVGFVDSAEAKTEAARVAAGIAGAGKVKNDLHVQTGERTAGQVVDDATITAKVKAALVQDSRTKGLQINVNTNSGVVQLAGYVDDANAKRAASEVAQSVSGVKSVRNDLETKS